jgi:hypothetical protein
MKRLLEAFLAAIGITPREPGRSPYFTGILPDQRSQEERDQDYLHEETALATAADPFGNPKLLSSPYPYENQQGTSSCVSHGVGLALAILRAAVTGKYIRLGWLFHYRRRSNFPGEGYVISEGFLNYKRWGAPLYASSPDVATEAQANALKITAAMTNEAELFEGLEYYMFQKPNDIAALAAVAQTGAAVPISIFATYDEWARQYPTILYPTLAIGDWRAEVNHEICILPHSGFTENGVRYVAIQDSAWFGGYQLRYLSEDFIARRVTTAGYWKKVNVVATGPRPKFVFTRSLAVGAQGMDVRALQQLLISEGLLPADCITGYFGGRTLAGVRAFQMKYQDEILAPLGLAAPTSTFGAASIRKANALCA